MDFRVSFVSVGYRTEGFRAIIFQQAPPPFSVRRLLAVAVLVFNGTDRSHMPYSEMHANAPVGGCGCFWMNGGDGDFFVPLWLNFSGVVEAGGHTTDRIANFDTGLNLFYGMGGIRMRLPNTRSSGRSAEGFWRSAWVRQLLPTPVGKLPTSYGVSCALPLEAAWIIAVSEHIWIRAIQTNYFYSELRNLQGNRQHQLGLGAGIVSG